MAKMFTFLLANPLVVLIFGGLTTFTMAWTTTPVGGTIEILCISNNTENPYFEVWKDYGTPSVYNLKKVTPQTNSNMTAFFYIIDPENPTPKKLESDNLFDVIPSYDGTSNNLTVLSVSQMIQSVSQISKSNYFQFVTPRIERTFYLPKPTCKPFIILTEIGEEESIPYLTLYSSVTPKKSCEATITTTTTITAASAETEFSTTSSVPITIESRAGEPTPTTSIPITVVSSTATPTSSIPITVASSATTPAPGTSSIPVTVVSPTETPTPTSSIPITVASSATTPAPATSSIPVTVVSPTETPTPTSSIPITVASSATTPAPATSSIPVTAVSPTETPTSSIPITVASSATTPAPGTSSIPVTVVSPTATLTSSIPITVVSSTTPPPTTTEAFTFSQTPPTLAPAEGVYAENCIWEPLRTYYQYIKVVTNATWYDWYLTNCFPMHVGELLFFQQVSDHQWINASIPTTEIEQGCFFLKYYNSGAYIKVVTNATWFWWYMSNCFPKYQEVYLPFQDSPTTQTIPTVQTTTPDSCILEEYFPNGDYMKVVTNSTWFDWYMKHCYPKYVGKILPLIPVEDYSVFASTSTTYTPPNLETTTVPNTEAQKNFCSTLNTRVRKQSFNDITDVYWYTWYLNNCPETEYKCC